MEFHFLTRRSFVINVIRKVTLHQIVQIVHQATKITTTIISGTLQIVRQQQEQKATTTLKEHIHQKPQMQMETTIIQMRDILLDSNTVIFSHQHSNLLHTKVSRRNWHITVIMEMIKTLIT